MLKELFFIPIAMMVAPGAAILPAVIFTGFYIIRRNKISKYSRIATIFTISVWVMYWVYCMYVTGKYFWMNTGPVPLGGEVYLIPPLLYLVTIVGIIGLIGRVVKGLIILASISISIAVIVGIWPEPECSRYGGKAYCSPCEQDAKNVLASLASYFSDPENMRMPTVDVLRYDADLYLNNPVENVILFPEPGELAQNQTISVRVIDDTECCPRNNAYIAIMGGGAGYWE